MSPRSRLSRGDDIGTKSVRSSFPRALLDNGVAQLFREYTVVSGPIEFTVE